MIEKLHWMAVVVLLIVGLFIHPLLGFKGVLVLFAGYFIGCFQAIIAEEI